MATPTNEPASLSFPKEHDYAPHPEVTPNIIGTPHSDADTDTTATNSSDEFDWEADEEAKDANDLAGKVKAKRGRAVYLACMKLSRTVRTLLVGALGAGVLITPLIVVQLRFHDNAARSQVHVWSMWLSIIWATGCVTYLLVDLLPHLILSLVVLFGGHVERQKTQVEVRFISISRCSRSLIVSSVVGTRSICMGETGLGRIMGVDQFVHHPCCI